MCAKVIYKGKEEEAYSLSIYENHAREILRGEKTVEIRSMTPKNWAMFINKDVKQKWDDACHANLPQEELDKFIEEHGPWPFMKDVFAIHFYDRGGRFSLDVVLDEVGFSPINRDTIENFNEHFNFHDYDNEWQQYTNLADCDKPHVFWFHVLEVIGHTGLD